MIIVLFNLLWSCNNGRNNEVQNFQEQIEENKENDKVSLGSCDICGKDAFYYTWQDKKDKMIRGHYIEMYGQEASEKVCGYECDLKMRERIKKQIDNENYTYGKSSSSTPCPSGMVNGGKCPECFGKGTGQGGLKCTSCNGRGVLCF